MSRRHVEKLAQRYGLTVATTPGGRRLRLQAENGVLSPFTLPANPSGVGQSLLLTESKIKRWINRAEAEGAETAMQAALQRASAPRPDPEPEPEPKPRPRPKPRPKPQPKPEPEPKPEEAPMPAPKPAPAAEPEDDDAPAFTRNHVLVDAAPLTRLAERMGTAEAAEAMGLSPSTLKGTRGSGLARKAYVMLAERLLADMDAVAAQSFLFAARVPAAKRDLFETMCIAMDVEAVEISL